MEITAIAKFSRISPKKVQPWLKNLRRQPAAAALDSLRYVNTKAGRMVYKVIASAVSNAVNNYNFKPDNLRIKSLTVDEGPRQKRYWFRSHGSADVRLKRLAHIKVVIEETTQQTITKPLTKSVASKAGLQPDKTKVLSDKSSKPAGPTGKSENMKVKKSTTRRIFSRTTNK
ncbi:TPA: 50S ribosomal protein L22 [Patescibacteria group bacterium]|uniref:Large ribosomal subunit protein uL22 n=1 Tax=candidate division Kazan bacterium GW2011_GWA1_44_22 TaxID=1620410 RepID=A0A0G1I279_UNCK3|nr:MAG: 50S ribosomal protein L22 [candidate division Kazan bacterium GW2011_GWA1_44_22]HAR55024.1 50S ribosomal protein L22 [Patescibacteria group bacterium]HCR41916.1 50S ribosomal protein L22 [Patescibacteria group bacterium]